MSTHTANTHLMIVHPRYIGKLMTGEKLVEARLGRDRRAPFNHVRQGDVVYIKPTSQSVAARAVVERVDQYEDLEPVDIEKLQELYDDRVQGGDEFWESKSEARFATMITLSKVRPIGDERFVPQELLVPSRNAWRTLDRECARRAA
jgi:predicted transcriptional regulator